MPTPPARSTVYERAQKTGFLSGPNDKRFGAMEPDKPPEQSDGSDPEQPGEPPNLHNCECCAHCKFYSDKACDKYGGYSVEPMETCDSFEESSGVEESPDSQAAEAA